MLPQDLKTSLDTSSLLIGPGKAISAGDSELPVIRQAIRGERKLRIRYLDGNGRDSRRTIWPFALGFFDRVRVVVAWCEMREDFPAFPDRPHRQGAGHGQALPAPPPGSAEGMARGGRNPRIARFHY